VHRSLTIALVLLALTPVACDHGEPASFAEGTTMARLQHAGRIRIGVKSDQPSLGFRDPATDRYEGFDIEIATMIAGELGLDRKQIQFVTTTSAVRERYLVEDRVDVVVASYSMNDQRRQVVGQAGPYFVTGQQLLVRRADRDTISRPGQLTADRVCSAQGSTSIDNWERLFHGRPIAAQTYTDCVRGLLSGTFDGVTTDGAVLLGYAAQLPTKLAVVGEPFSVDEYGIGYPKGDLALCEFLSQTITAVEHDGRWDKAFQATLGRAGVPIPAKPKLQPCRP